MVSPAQLLCACWISFSSSLQLCKELKRRHPYSPVPSAFTPFFPERRGLENVRQGRALKAAVTDTPLSDQLGKAWMA